MNLKPLLSESLFQGLYLKTNEYFREKIDNKKQTEDKIKTLAGAYLLQYGLKRQGFDPERVKIETVEKGKPYIAGTFFNISHSGDLAVCAFGDSEIGVDIEKIRPASERVKNKISLPSERAKISAAKQIIRLWTRKEAFGKCLGSGIGEDIFKIDLMGDTVYYNGNTYGIRTLCFDEYYLSVCTENDMPNTEIIKVKPTLD